MNTDTAEQVSSAIWPLYEGTKQLKAKPMTLGDYNAFRGWTMPDDENPSDEGYVVEYVDGGKPNLPGFTGYVSWSPKAVFEQHYRPCETHHQRMALEMEQLTDRIEKLKKFIYFNPRYGTLSKLDQGLMQTQLVAMTAYETSLSLRIQSAQEQGQ